MTQSSLQIGDVDATTALNDVNVAYAALATLSTGATAPSSPFPNQLWYDTTASVLKQRNNANTAWLVFRSAIGAPADSSNSDFAIAPDAAARRDLVQAKLDALAALPRLGEGQTWQNVKASRSSGTTYQNTTGKPIMVAIQADGDTREPQVSSDGVTFVDLGDHNFAANISFVVPAGHYYRLSGGSIEYWAELR